MLFGKHILILALRPLTSNTVADLRPFFLIILLLPAQRKETRTLIQRLMSFIKTRLLRLIKQVLTGFMKYLNPRIYKAIIFLLAAEVKKLLTFFLSIISTNPEL